MIRRITLMAGAALAALMLVACDSTPAMGTIVAKQYEPSRTVMEYTPDCGLGLDGSFTCGELKLKMVTHPERFEFILRSCPGDIQEECKDRSVRVNGQIYSEYKVGDYYIQS